MLKKDSNDWLNRDGLKHKIILMLVIVISVLAAHSVVLFWPSGFDWSDWRSILLFSAALLCILLNAIAVILQECGEIPFCLKRVFYPFRFLLTVVVLILVSFVFWESYGWLDLLLNFFMFLLAFTLNCILFLFEFLDIFFTKIFKDRIVEI